jgi:surfeit locus 1 family protein
VDAAKDQEAADAPDQPVGGLTVITFHNSHLVYAITWYALALMVAGAWWWSVRRPHAE